MELQFTKLDDDVIICESAFTGEELSTITNICNHTLATTPIIDTATGDNTTRKVVTSAFPRTTETAFIYKQMANVLKQINDRYFQFDIMGIAERGLFFVSYNLPDDHLDWHTDKINYNGTRTDLVKLGIVLQLSDPSEYDGCDVEIMTDGILTIKKTRGLIYCIPGYVSHRVTKLNSGVRNIAIAWVTGPKFR